ACCCVAFAASQLLLPLALFRLFFRLLRRPPPTSTLFPYTTLFRSRTGEVGRTLLAQSRRDALGDPADDHRRRRLHRRPRAPLHRDRKSTRLNSSHVSISYAVFCLTKKKHVTMI